MAVMDTLETAKPMRKVSPLRVLAYVDMKGTTIWTKVKKSMVAIFTRHISDTKLTTRGCFKARKINGIFAVDASRRYSLKLRLRSFLFELPPTYRLLSTAQ
jgi:hypothetical protein